MMGMKFYFQIFKSGSSVYFELDHQRVYPAHHSHGGLQDQDLPVIHQSNAVWDNFLD